jgi:hypothetical protein
MHGWSALLYAQIKQTKIWLPLSQRVHFICNHGSCWRASSHFILNFLIWALQLLGNDVSLLYTKDNSLFLCFANNDLDTLFPLYMIFYYKIILFCKPNTVSIHAFGEAYYKSIQINWYTLLFVREQYYAIKEKE